MINIIDTFKDYEICFRDKLDSPVEDKIDLWERCYISKYPELEKKCKDGYESKGHSWRRIAQEKVFNRTEKDFNKMTCAHRNILEAMKSINTRAEEIIKKIQIKDDNRFLIGSLYPPSMEREVILNRKDTL